MGGGSNVYCFQRKGCMAWGYDTRSAQLITATAQQHIGITVLELHHIDSERFSSFVAASCLHAMAWRYQALDAYGPSRVFLIRWMDSIRYPLRCLALALNVMI